MDWKAHALILHVQIKIGVIQNSQLIDWAVGLLEHKIETAHVLKLACAYVQESRFDLEVLFQKSLSELKLLFPEDDQLFKDYAVLIAHAVLRNEVPPATGLDLLNQVNYQRQEWDPLLRPICDLYAAVELSADHMQSYLYAEFEQMPLADLIREECQLYLDLSQLETQDLLPEDLLNTSYCLNCAHRIKPVQAPESWLAKTWRQLTGNQALRPWMCPDCNNTRFLSLMTLAGRKRFIDCAK